MDTRADDLLQQAIAYHQAGRLAQAEALCRQILQSNPCHPVALHLLGIVAHQAGRHTLALQLIDSALAGDPACADAWNNRGIVLYALAQYADALSSYDRALQLNPACADAHSNRGNALHALERYREALLSCDRALELNPNHPEAHNNRGNALRALTEFQPAIEAYDRALRLRPGYAEALRNRGNAMQALTFASGHAGKTASSGRDLVFYCGPAASPWNPRTIAASGIGGSEESVLWLSGLLHQRGWNTTVYADCGLDETTHDGVHWKPYWLWNPRDRQDATILWRHPSFADHAINSARVFLDLHDVIPESELTPGRLRRIDRIFVKSGFHRSLFPSVPGEKFHTIPNGIDAQLFQAQILRDPYLLIYTSSADRSLEAFLDCFQQIQREVPEARAQWAYGWHVWDAVNAADPRKMRWKAVMQDRMAQLGVHELGRLSHIEVARLYHSAGVFLYPTEMAEIDCISLSKAMAAGAIPITTHFAALGEKSGHGGIFVPSRKTKDNWALPGQFHFEVTDPDQRSQFVRAAVDLLRNPPSESAREPMRQWARSTFDWSSIAACWHHALLADPAGSAQAQDAGIPIEAPKA